MTTQTKTQRRPPAGRKRATASRTATTAQPEVTGLEALAAQAERALLIPVGAALVARDSVVEVARPFTTRTGAEEELSRLQTQVTAQLKSFERRGASGRNRLRREVKRTRTRLERQLRQRRSQVTRLVRRNRRSVRTQVKAARRDFERRANGLQTSAEDLVQRVQEQVSTLA